MSAPALTQAPQAGGGMPPGVRAWINEEIEARRVSLHAQGRNLRGGTGDWWRTLREDRRCFLLSTVAPDDWERYMAVPWGALPAAMRACIGQEARALLRAMQGCIWR